MADQAHSDSSGQVTVPLNQLEDMISNIMKRHLQQQKEDIVNVILDRFSNEIEDLQMKVASLQFENENLAEGVKILEGAKAKNDSTIAKEVHIRSVSIDQYARRANMIIYGLNETEKENTNKLVANTIKKSIKLEIKWADLEITHRLGRKEAGKILPMAVKFRFRDLKWEVVKARKGFKGTKLSFHEDMCKEYQQLERKVRDEDAVSATWFWNGKLFAKHQDGRIHTIFMVVIGKPFSLELLKTKM